MSIEDKQGDIEQIRLIVSGKAERFRSRMGDVVLAGVDGGTVRIAPTGYCWRWHITRVSLVQGLEKELKERFPWVEQVVVAKPSP